MSSPLRVVDFADNIIDKTIHFKVILMNDSFFVWIGAEPKFSNLAVAMPTRFGSTPSSTSLLKNKTENNSPLLAQKLAKRFSKQVFVSCGLPFDQQASLQVEKRLSEELGPLLS